MRRPYAGFLAATALVVLAGHAASQCGNLPCDPRPFTNNLWTLDDYGGFSVAVDGNVAVAGAPGDFNSPYPFGAAYVYERQLSGEWIAVTRLQKASLGTLDTQFGFSVDIVGDTILVGDPSISAPGVGAGAAYVYERPAGGWGASATLTENAMLRATEVGGPPATNAGIRCGRSVALSADGATAYVGTPFWHDQIPFSGRRREGRVLVFRSLGASWGSSMSPPTYNEVAQLGRSEDFLPDFTSIGWSLDIIANPGGGERVVAGGVADAAASSGTIHGVWAWDEPAGGWESSMTTQYGIPVNYVPITIPGPDPTVARHTFGEDVSFLDRLTVAVGSPSEQGVHVYTEIAPGTWEQEGPLIQPCVSVNPFGTGVAFAQDGMLLVGTGLGQGVFTYERVPDPDMMNPTGMMWTGLNRILPRVATRLNSHFAGGFNSEFGRSLAVSGGTCLVGMPTGYPGQPQRPGQVFVLDLDCMCVTPDSSLTNWWTGDADFVDLVTGIPGTPIGDTTRGPALAGSGFNFDSTNDAVDLGTTAGNFGTGNFTAELWCALNPEGSNLAYSVWLEKHDGTDGWWLDNVSFGSRLRLVVGSGGDLFEISGSLSGVSGGVNYELFAGANWSHVAVTRQGMTYTLYWNGEMIAQGDDDVVLDLSSMAPLYLGGNQSLSGSVNGQLDEVSLYDEALSQAEIREIVFAYGAAKCKVLDNEPPVVAITSPNDGNVFGTTSVTLEADVTDDGATSVTSTPAGISVSLPAGGDSVSGTVPLLFEGFNTLTVSALDDAGNTGGSSVTVIRDTIPPVVNVLSPPDGSILGSTPGTLTVDVVDATATTLTFGGNSFPLPAGGGMASGDVALVEGTNVIPVTAVDAAGNSTTVFHALILDLTAPLVTIDAPPDGACFGPGDETIAVTATVDDLTATSVDSDPTGVSGSLPMGGGMVAGAVDLVEGSNTITVSATDQTDRTGSDSIVVLLDTLPPIVAVLVPMDGHAIRGTVDFDADATDDGTGVSLVDFRVDGNLVDSQFLGPFESSFDTTTVFDGNHTFSVDAVDGKGNSASASIIALVDNTPPAISIPTPLDGALVSGTIAFDANASDGGSGLSAVSMLAGGSAPNPVDDSVVLGTPVASTLRMSQVDTSAFPDGLVALEATAFDDAGNQAMATVTIEVDNSSPDKSLVTPADGAIVAGLLDILAQAEDPNLASLEILVDGISIASSSTSPLATQFDTTTRIDGPMVVTVIATDSLGNSSTCSATVTVDNVASIHCALHPETLNLKSKGKKKSVTAKLEGASLALLIPTEEHDWQLRVPGGSPVPSTAGFAGDDHLQDGDGLTVKFDRQLLIASIEAGIAAGEIQRNSVIEVDIYADGALICTDQLRIIH